LEIVVCAGEGGRVIVGVVGVMEKAARSGEKWLHVRREKRVDEQLRDSGLCWGRWESDCRSSGSGGEGSKKWGEVVVGKAGKTVLDPSSFDSCKLLFFIMANNLPEKAFKFDVEYP
nr:hypothetical protein [Tanacetum cinerariifolium]